MKLGEVLKREREKRGISTTKLADKLGLSEERYRKIEAGESGLESAAVLLHAYSKAVGVPVQELFHASGLAFQELDDYP